jgi:hypothetical protein
VITFLRTWPLVFSQVRTNILKTLKVIIWRLKVIIFQDIQKKRIDFQVRVLLSLGFSMGFRKHNLSTTSSAPPLAGASWKSFPLFYKKGSTWPHHSTTLHASILFLLLHFNATLCASTILLLVLHCSCPCFTATPPHALLHCSSLCFVVPCASLLLSLCCCSSCFTTLHASLLFFLLLRSYSSCFVAPTTLLLCGVLLLSMLCYSITLLGTFVPLVVFLLLRASLLFNVLLLPCQY